MFDRMAVHRADVFHARKRTDEHQKRGFGQVEIGNQAVDDAEAVARRDKNIGVALSRFQTTCLARGGFEGAHGSGADCPNFVSARMGGFDGGDGFGRYVKPFAVHFVFFDFVHAHGLERSRTDVQGYFHCFHTFGFQTT